MDIPTKIIKTYSSMFFPKKREHFENSSDYLYNITMVMISWIIFGFAIYLSFRWHKGFDLGGFLLAVFFSPFYILYHLALTNLGGLMK